MSTENGEQNVEFIESVAELMHHSFIFGRVPLFVIGSGISFDRVPMLSEIGLWLKTSLESAKDRILERESWVVDFCSELATGTASRRQATEFFAALQGEIPITEPSRTVFDTIWTQFTHTLLAGPLTVPADGGLRSFSGILDPILKPSYAHRFIAHMLLKSQAHVISLNFDGLTRKALQQSQINPRNMAIALHTEEEILNYFSTTRFFGPPNSSPPPAVIKVRGDVFYARCRESACPWSAAEYPLDRLTLEQANGLICPNCGSNSLRLRFSFPGYRAKEEAAYPTLWTSRRFIAQSTSAIVMLGFSGNWDQYMLEFLFDFARERQIPIVDVKPDACSLENLVENFRAMYYPAVDQVTDTSIDIGATFIPIGIKADAFAIRLSNALFGADVVREHVQPRLMPVSQSTSQGDR